VVAHMWRDELRAKMDRGDPFVLLDAFYSHRRMVRRQAKEELVVAERAG
jgi:hypothetical protein